MAAAATNATNTLFLFVIPCAPFLGIKVAEDTSHDPVAGPQYSWVKRFSQLKFGPAARPEMNISGRALSAISRQLSAITLIKSTGKISVDY
jgi:hypothetical protein